MPVVPTLDVENYLDFKAMTHYLKAVSSAAPHLVRAFSIGKSKGGRPLLVAEVTNRNLREGRHKPGIWIDGGHQGWNLLGSMACLELLRFLVAGHGRDEFLTDLVDHTVFYVAPRLAPDEMEMCLANGALVPQQIMGEGPVSELGRQFRSTNPLGSWKQFKRDNRVLVPRNPEDRKGPFYNLYRNVDSSRLACSSPQDFPSRDPSEVPLQLPSTRAIFEFMRSYSNVFAVISCSGPGDRLQLVGQNQESSLAGNLGRRLSELAGLPLSPEASDCSRPGQFLHWARSSLGVLAADCRMWSMRNAAGLKKEDLEDPFAADENELLHLIRFCEKEFPDGSYADWSEMEDPLLGKGEVGGWNWSQTWLNPPRGPYLGRELKKLSRLTLGLASAAPRLGFGEVKEEVVGWSTDNQPLRKIQVEVQNVGFLPTCPIGGEHQPGGKVVLKLGANSLLIGQATTALEEMRGNGQPVLEDGLPQPQVAGGLPKNSSVKLEYLLKGSAVLEIAATHPLAGTENTSTKPPQGLRPPSFDASAPVPATMEQTSVTEDPFEEAFPSFEELYQEPPSAPEPPPPPPLPPRPTVDSGAPTKKLTAPAAAAPPPIQESPLLDTGSPFDIPDPAPPAQTARPVRFSEIGGSPQEQKQSPFPAKKPAKGRVFGSPPQKPGGGLPAALGGMGGAGPTPSRPASPSEGGDFSPLPLVKSEKSPSSAFEPMAPPAKAAPTGDIFGAETIGGADREQSSETPLPPLPMPDDAPSAPPPRLSRMSAPKLLRRQRGGQGPNDSFKPR